MKTFWVTYKGIEIRIEADWNGQSYDEWAIFLGDEDVTEIVHPTLFTFCQAEVEDATKPFPYIEPEDQAV